MKVSESDLEIAHKVVCQEYQRFRASGGSASSPYVYFLIHQKVLHSRLRREGRGDFELYELGIFRPDGTSAVVDLRHLAPEVFGEHSE